MRRSGFALGSALAALCLPLERAGAQMDMHDMPHGAALPLGIPESRSGSGTSWVPDRTSQHAIHATAGDWSVMVHGAMSLLVDAQGGPRGATEVRLLNWGMTTFARSAAGGRLELRAMLSAEPATVGADGYALLLQSGESNHGVALHDRQHPHDLFMETAVRYDHAIVGSIALSLYVAPAGEPALGPPAYPHRPSAAWDPLAPIGHHWQDGTHVTYGVVTTGVYTRRVKLEASAFNGREPDENRTDFDFRGRRLDSYAGRVSVNPTAGLSLSAWYGFLRSPESLEPQRSLHRLGAGLLATGRPGASSWSIAAVYGANIAAGSNGWSNSGLVEANVQLDRASALFGRVEFVQKSARDLNLPGNPDTRHDVGELSLGLFHVLRRVADVELGGGVRGTVNVVPPSVRNVYGSRWPVGAALYITLRP